MNTINIKDIFPLYEYHKRYLHFFPWYVYNGFRHDMSTPYRGGR